MDIEVMRCKVNSIRKWYINGGIKKKKKQEARFQAFFAFKASCSTQFNKKIFLKVTYAAS